MHLGTNICFSLKYLSYQRRIWHPPLCTLCLSVPLVCLHPFLESTGCYVFPFYMRVLSCHDFSFSFVLVFLMVFSFIQLFPQT